LKSLQGERSRSERTARFAIGMSTTLDPDAITAGTGRPICVVTRFALRSPLSVPALLFGYLRIVREARGVEGFQAASFHISGPRTVVIFSIWSDFKAIAAFGTRSMTHLRWAKHSMTQVRMNDGPAIWSTKWLLSGASNNLNWPGLDFSSFKPHSERDVVRES
jgi:hypothetical protein